MKKVYIQIIDPLNGTCMNACHEYPSEYNQAVKATLKQYGIYDDSEYTFEGMTNTESDLPGMPKYAMCCGKVEGTSKLVSITVVG